MLILKGKIAQCDLILSDQKSYTGEVNLQIFGPTHLSGQHRDDSFRDDSLHRIWVRQVVGIGDAIHDLEQCKKMNTDRKSGELLSFCIEL